jgi:hypothetical protein
MKFFVIAALLALGSCTQPKSGCPAIEALSQRNAVADARTALAKGDHHLLMLGGFVGEVPGVSNANGYSTRMVEGTSDTTSNECRQRVSIAKAYAEKYNRTIVQPR